MSKNDDMSPEEFTREFNALLAKQERAAARQRALEEAMDALGEMERNSLALKWGAHCDAYNRALNARHAYIAAGGKLKETP